MESPDKNRLLMLLLALRAKRVECEKAGVDSDSDPVVRAIQKRISDEMPDAKRLLDRMRAIEQELTDIVIRWHSNIPGTTQDVVLEHAHGMIKQAISGEKVQVEQITQDVHAKELLIEYSRLQSQLTVMMSKEGARSGNTRGVMSQSTKLAMRWRRMNWVCRST